MIRKDHLIPSEIKKKEKCNNLFCDGPLLLPTCSYNCSCCSRVCLTNHSPVSLALSTTAYNGYNNGYHNTTSYNNTNHRPRSWTTVFIGAVTTTTKGTILIIGVPKKSIINITNTGFCQSCIIRKRLLNTFIYYYFINKMGSGLFWFNHYYFIIIPWFTKLHMG